MTALADIRFPWYQNAFDIERVTRDYAYFLENRLRSRYGMEGVPLVIDFVERSGRREAVDAGGSRRPRR